MQLGLATADCDSMTTCQLPKGFSRYSDIVWKFYCTVVSHDLSSLPGIDLDMVRLWSDVGSEVRVAVRHLVRVALHHNLPGLARQWESLLGGVSIADFDHVLRAILLAALRDEEEGEDQHDENGHEGEDEDDEDDESSEGEAECDGEE